MPASESEHRNMVVSLSLGGSIIRDVNDADSQRNPSGTPELWPIFICYRRADGAATARRLHEMLDKYHTATPDGQGIIIDAYLDETMPGVADWRNLHRPYLEKARAIIVVCTPGLKLDEGPDDWVQREIRWWLEERTAAPILIDPLAQGARYVPDGIKRRWPEIQRLVMVESEWTGLSEAEWEKKTEAVRRQILGAILPSGAEIYVQELEEERQRVVRLRWALVLSLALMVAAVTAGGLAYLLQQRALTSAQVAEASRVDSEAATAFAESRFYETKWDAEKGRQEDLRRLLATSTTDARKSNLEHEIEQSTGLLARYAAEARVEREAGRALHETAKGQWNALEQAGQDTSIRPQPDLPRVFSIELINAGKGEAILIHYGTPDATSLVMINAGDTAGFKQFVEPRLRQISKSRFNSEPVPIELFIAGDQDADKTQGLLAMLQSQEKADESGSPLAQFGGIWANILQTQGRGLRPEIRRLIASLGIPLNQPFDHLVMRRPKGHVTISFSGGLEIVVLGPSYERLRDLYDLAAKVAEREGTEEPPMPTETFAKIPDSNPPTPLLEPVRAKEPAGNCVPSSNAKAMAGGAYIDASIPNRASTILLFRFAGKTFLHTGDSRGDLIIDGLQAAELFDAAGAAHVDLFNIPHLGSDNNVTPEFFQKVKAESYLFSGNGTHGNPEMATIASVVAARECDRYDLYFVNRAPEEDEHGKKLDEFFAAERQFSPNYIRYFRSEERGSVIIDLLDPVRY